MSGCRTCLYRQARAHTHAHTYTVLSYLIYKLGFLIFFPQLGLCDSCGSPSRRPCACTTQGFSTLVTFPASITRAGRAPRINTSQKWRQESTNHKNTLTARQSVSHEQAISHYLTTSTNMTLVLVRWRVTRPRHPHTHKTQGATLELTAMPFTPVLEQTDATH